MESIYVRTRQFDFLSLRLIKRVEVARYAEMAACIGAVGGDIHFNNGVVLKLIECCSRRTYYRVSRQLDDAIVAAAYANLILCTEHAKRLHAANLGFLDLETIVAIIKGRAEGGNNHLQSLAAIGSSTNNLERVLGRTPSVFAIRTKRVLLLAACLHARRQNSGCGDMQVVTVRVFLASEYLADYEPFQAAFDGLHFFYCTYLQTDRGEVFSYLLCIVGELEVAL